jgi:predicted component of type VI protein secretion system
MTEDSTVSDADDSGRGRPQVVLVIEDERTRTIALPNEGEIVIGRTGDASLRIEGPRISRRHARIVVSDDEVFVEDLGSHNGTRIGGVPIAANVQLPVRIGDVIECGGVHFLLRSSAPATSETNAGQRTLVVSDDARWFRRADGDPVHLGRRGALRLLLDVLVGTRMRAPGVALDVDAMFTAGWPEERIARESAQARVYTSVQRLRGLGLDGILITRGDGYLLDPAVDVRRG